MIPAGLMEMMAQERQAELLRGAAQRRALPAAGGRDRRAVALMVVAVFVVVAFLVALAPGAAGILASIPPIAG